MAAAADAAAPAPLHRTLPDEIVVWEILVRLPPKSLLRYRAVCPAWHRATSTRDFLLTHHGHQPSLSLGITTFDHRAGLEAVDQLQSVAQLGISDSFGLEASCDGFLVLSGRYRKAVFAICNPATRQYACLEELDGFAFLGMYPHSPTGEYRLLLRQSSYAPEDQDGYYVFTLGSGQPPRLISCPHEVDVVCEFPSVMFRVSLHWHVEQNVSGINMVKVFNTTTESFRWMRAPSVPGKANLFEMDGMLGMSSFNDAAATIDIWMAQYYESEAWAIKYRVELPVIELTVKFGMFHGKWSVVPSLEGDVFVLVEFGEWLLQIDMDNKLVASFHRALRCSDQLRLKQSLVPHSFFPTLEGYMVNDSPFI